MVSAAQVVVSAALLALSNLLENLLESGQMEYYLDRLLRNLRILARHCPWWTWPKKSSNWAYSASDIGRSNYNLGIGSKAAYRHE